MIQQRLMEDLLAGAQGRLVAGLTVTLLPADLPVLGLFSTKRQPGVFQGS